LLLLLLQADDGSSGGGGGGGGGGGASAASTNASGDAENAIVPIKLPNPGLLDGAKGKYTQVVKLENLNFWYQGAPEKVILKGVSGTVNLKSRIAILGANGAGKSTLMQLLIGELELPDVVNDRPEDRGKNKFGEVYRHHNLRVAYIAQHSMHHLEESLEDTAVAYVMQRFRFGMDRELGKVASVALTLEEKTRSEQSGEVCAVVARFLRAKELVYELEITDYRATVKKSLQQISFMPPYVLKLCRNFDEKLKAEQSGMALRPVTTKEILEHLDQFGITGELARRKIRWLSAGQKCRLVLAAASWNRPHMIALDEPTNYLDNETLASLTAALRVFQGAVIAITHNEGFVKALCNELWHVKEGTLTVQKLKEIQTVGPSVQQIAERKRREEAAETAIMDKAKEVGGSPVSGLI
jgi:ATPase subunit of ABC transporter with duplicated ATPase domains